MGTTIRHFHIVTARHGNTTLSIALSIELSIALSVELSIALSIELSIALSIALALGIAGDIALATTTDAGLVHADTDLTFVADTAAADLAPTTRGLRAFGASACGAELSCARLHRGRADCMRSSHNLLHNHVVQATRLVQLLPSRVYSSGA